MTPMSLEETLHKIADSQRRRDLWQVVTQYLTSRGVKRMSYHAVDAEATPIAIAAEGFPTDWVQQYKSRNYQSIDPFPELASHLTKPFYWHEVRELTEVDEESEAFLAARESADLGDGLALFVYGPVLQNAYVGLGFDVDRLELAEDVIFEFQCIAQAGHLRFCSINADRPRHASLTGREVEVLEWIAQGKSNSVIATILQMSVHTVDAHLRSIYKKLDVADRTSAALRGVGRGLIHYPPALT